MFLPVYKRPSRFFIVLASKSGRMTVRVLHSQGSSGGKRFRRKALGPPRTICKICKKQHVKWEQVEDVFNKSSKKKIFILAILDLVDLPSNIAITLQVNFKF